MNLDWILAKDTLHGGSGNTMSFGDLAQALATLTVLLDGEIVQYQGISADVFEAGAPHAGGHSLDDQVAFKFGDGADDDNDSPAQWAGGIDAFPEGDELDLESAQFIQNLQEVAS
jgi:hypothetical protein